MDLSSWEARINPPCVFFDWKTAVECAPALVCLKAANVPPVCMSCIAIDPGPILVVEGDVAQSIVSWRGMVVLEKNRMISRGCVWACVARVQNFLAVHHSSTAFFLSALPSQRCPLASTKSSVLQRMLYQSKVCRRLCHCQTSVERSLLPTVRRAYRKKALETHPDRLPLGATPDQKKASEDKFRKV